MITDGLTQAEADVADGQGMLSSSVSTDGALATPAAPLDLSVSNPVCDTGTAIPILITEQDLSVTTVAKDMVIDSPRSVPVTARPSEVVINIIGPTCNSTSGNG